MIEAARRRLSGPYRALLAGSALLVLSSSLAGGGETLRRHLDAPLLFVKRHSYKGIHIYDTYYKWQPGGGIYVLENPAAPPGSHKVRAVIDATTPGTLGEGVYSDPDLSWDATRILFCFKGAADGSTAIYEIGVNGEGLRQITDPVGCAEPAGRFTSHHDVGPAYLPDGRIVFTSTRGGGLVPCNNTGVDILHVMDASGENLHAISINPVNEFDPCVLPDGRILYGRWEYVDKTALTQQSLWTTFPDGTNEAALFANNLVRPEAFLDARPLPGSSSRVVASLTRHNGPPRGSIGVIDVDRGKNSTAAISNLEHPDAPTHDVGQSCEPWPLSGDVVLFSGRPAGHPRNVIEILSTAGQRELVLGDAAICCHSPMLVKTRARPPVLAKSVSHEASTGSFYVQDIYQGLEGVARGEVKWLRVIEETSRASGTHGKAFNQTFLVSAALAFSVKNYLGVVPVGADGSVYFEAPSGRSIYFQALDADRRLVQSMRTYVQAAPGVTRSCIGCHEHKYSAPANLPPRRDLRRKPAKLQPETWGGGFLDYPGRVQPVLDRRCVRCHGGEEGMAAGLDLTGGWTEHFNISYENLVSRRHTQLTAHLISGIDCMNGTARWSARIFPPRSHGSATAPVADIVVDGHQGRIPDLTTAERDLILAWIDSNGLYHGTWDYSEHGCSVDAWKRVRESLVQAMRDSGCGRCHESDGRMRFESDWFNLQTPELSRILRASLADGGPGLGLALCRDRGVDPDARRVRLYYSGGYVHHVLPLESFEARPAGFTTPPPRAGEAVVTFESTTDPRYRSMLETIRRGRRDALTRPRVDMPGADVEAGRCRQILTAAPGRSRARSTDDDAVTDEAFEQARRSARIAGYSISKVQRWLHERALKSIDAATGLYRTGGRWNYRDTAADCYPFACWAAWLVDPAALDGPLREVLHAEQRLCNHLDRIPTRWDFGKKAPDTSVSHEQLIFGASEYVKDGLIAIVEVTGKDEWFERMKGIEEDIWKHARVDTPFGKIPSRNIEVNGEQLQALARLYTMTGEEKFLVWARRLGDFYLADDDFMPQRLRDHGCEIIGGLGLLLAVESSRSPDRAERLQARLGKMFDEILARGCNEDGIMFNTLGRPGPLSDGWGYNYVGYLCHDMASGRPRYRGRVEQTLRNLSKPRYASYSWEGTSIDGYADSIEGAIYLLNRVPVAEGFAWIDREAAKHVALSNEPLQTANLWGTTKLQSNGVRTVILHALMHTQGVRALPWRPGLRLGACQADGALKLVLASDGDWSGKLHFDRPRHRLVMGFEQDWPRMNTVPEWFTVESDRNYTVKGLPSGTRRISGQQLHEGLPLRLEFAQTVRLEISDAGSKR